MTPVTQLSEMPRYQIRQAQMAPRRREGTAEIHILPCIRRETLATPAQTEAQRPS